MNKMHLVFNTIAAAVGAVLGFLFGEVTGLFWALIAFMALDYITGVIIAIINKKLCFYLSQKLVANLVASWLLNLPQLQQGSE